jgi:mannosyltransferase OCH1-like enzyme
MIPLNIYQTHKSLEFINSDKRLVNATNSWKRNKKFTYNFYDDKQCSDFMEAHYPEIKPLYDKLPLNVMKADLWRYCIIYTYGGIYADCDTILKTDISIFVKHQNKQFVVAPENETHFCQWVFSAPPNSPVLKSIIDLSIQRIRDTEIIKGEHIVHYLTGPAVFTDGILLYLKSQNIQVLKTTSQVERGSTPLLPNNDDVVIYDKQNYGRLKTVDIFKYEKIQCDILIYNHNIFHKICVIHLFSGSWPNGWTKERDKLLK